MEWLLTIALGATTTAMLGCTWLALRALRCGMKAAEDMLASLERAEAAMRRAHNDNGKAS